jgi:hypothetical protein
MRREAVEQCTILAFVQDFEADFGPQGTHVSFGSSIVSVVYA